MKTHFSKAALAVCAALPLCSQTEELGAHVHGEAQLSIAISGKHVEMAFASPAANLVGFEHKARTATEHDAVESAERTLGKVKELFSFGGATCMQEVVSIDVGSLSEHHADGHDEHDEHDEHEHSEHHEDEHDHHEHKEHHDEAAHEHEEHENNHSEIEASYRFSCVNLSGLKSISVNLIEHFPAIEHIETVWLTDSKQGSAELSRKNNIVRLD